MKCPYCGCTDTKVYDTRHREGLDSICRVRACQSSRCGLKFKTHEFTMHQEIADELKEMSFDQFLRLMVEVRIRARRTGFQPITASTAGRI